MKAFIDTILDDPFNNDPLLVLADWLMERGDPRGEILVLYPKIVEEVKKLSCFPEVSFADRTYRVKKILSPTLLRLFSVLQAMYTPVRNKILKDYMTNAVSQRCITMSLLYTFGLATPQQMNEYYLLAKASQRSPTVDTSFTAAWAASTTAEVNPKDAAWIIESRTTTTVTKSHGWQTNLALWLQSFNLVPMQIRYLLWRIHGSAH